ncbi:MAG: sensor histidine kinase [Candidatus Paceibacterales bacterium]
MKKTNFLKKPKTADIVSIVAHQLKTPISVIKGYLEALKAGDCGKINPLQKEYLTDALVNVKKMSGFIENLLDVSRIEENRFDIKLEPVALEELTAQILINLAPWFEANNCEISFKMPEKLPKVLTDRLRIRQVIQNLISNAVLYKEGRGKVEIALKEKNKKVLFICKDNGVGVPENEFKKIFSKFYRSEEAMELDPSGSGIGLYINKAIIELSKGRIWFKKNKDRGMTFYFSLPIAKP